jgi:hypothetical protein
LFSQSKRIKPLKVITLVGLFALVCAAPTIANTQGSTMNWTEYVGVMNRTHTPGSGCFTSTYPIAVWVPVPCVQAPDPFETVGSGTDYSADAGSNHIGLGTGSFSSVAGLSWETDSKKGTNYYSLQLNSNTYSCTYSSNPTTCWVQFVFQNNPGASSGYVFISYALLNYFLDYATCPTYFSHPNNIDCYSQAGSHSTPQESISNLATLSLSGSSNYASSGQDKANFCVSGSCYAATISDTRYTQFALSQSWTNMEFNVLGYAAQSTAGFNGGTNITISDTEQTVSGGSITPTCLSGGGSAEKNNLSLRTGTCNVSGGTMTFKEWGYYYLTMQVSGNGYVRPGSGYYSAGTGVTITGYPNPGCHTFDHWTGSGTGSYSGTNNPATVTIRGPITETAYINNFCAPAP